MQQSLIEHQTFNKEQQDNRSTQTTNQVAYTIMENDLNKIELEPTKKESNKLSDYIDVYTDRTIYLPKNAKNIAV